ncbi:MAG: SAM-dependent methyltransferase, partial [Actinocrinis sp.]
VLHFVQDFDNPAGLLARLIRDFPAGSHVVVSHGSADFNPAGALEATETYHATSSYVPRTGQAINALFGGMSLIEPGLVPLTQWPDTSVPARGEMIGMYAAIGKKTA